MQENIWLEDIKGLVEDEEMEKSIKGIRKSLSTGKYSECYYTKPYLVASAVL